MNAGARISGIALLDALERGEVRCAERGVDGAWRVNAWVKEEILAVFRSSQVVPMGLESPPSGAYLDKEPLAPRRFEPAQGVRIVPGGSAVRRGAFLARGVVVMPPAYVNIGAWIGEGTMVDSHALVGSCAQIGKNCHISGGAGIGGVLEPLQANPVIIEDNCFIGARSEIAEGVIVEKGAVISMGVYIGASTKIIDRESGEIFYGRVPAYSVVVPGNIQTKNNLSLYAAIIVKKVDEKTRSKTSINELLRD